MAEMKTPEDVAKEWLHDHTVSHWQRRIGPLAELLRQERERAFDAGLRAGRSRKLERLVSEASRGEDSAKLYRAGARHDELLEEAKRKREEAGKLVAAARLAAVEGRKEGEGDAV